MRPSNMTSSAASPDTAKAARVLDFSADVPIRESVREVVGWVRAELNAGRL